MKMHVGWVADTVGQSWTVELYGAVGQHGRVGQCGAVGQHIDADKYDNHVMS